jgi:hypothetical protein
MTQLGKYLVYLKGSIGIILKRIVVCFSSKPFIVLTNTICQLFIRSDCTIKTY